MLTHLTYEENGIVYTFRIGSVVIDNITKQHETIMFPDNTDPNRVSVRLDGDSFRHNRAPSELSKYPEKG